MTLYFSWLDYSEKERRKMLNVIHLFEEKDTIDELGLGSIRDAVAERFFPGTGTVQTRARYLFFISWMYMKLEEKRVSSSKIAERARNEELRLIERLLEQGETEGVIGRMARRKLQRIPSNIYWLGLETLGFRRYSATQADYHRYLDIYYQRLSAAKDRSSEDDEVVIQPNWNPGIPPPPQEFPDQPSFALRKSEAEFLLEQLKLHAPNSVMTWVGINTKGTEEYEDTDYLWDYTRIGEMPRENREEIQHAHLFSLAMNGASLLYNLMLAQKGVDEIEDKEAAWSEKVDLYEKRIRKWLSEVRKQEKAYEQWNVAEFWEFIRHTGARVKPQTGSFINDWLNMVRLGPPKDIASNTALRKMIEYRETQLKRANARLTNRAALENWSGASMNNQLSFRWRNARVILRDLHHGLGRT